MTKRSDSEFWKNFQKKHPPPPELAHILKIMKAGTARPYDFHNLKKTCSFELTSYLQVGHGLGFIEKDINLLNYENINPSPAEYKKIINNMLYRAEDHTKFLKRI
jgi:hypothetical protein